ncbi:MULTISPECIES: Fic family protein [Corynebacterium]|uniref:Fic family protein n=1 Tax=Corynebacterium TaxID=1716 RepID=UPI0025943D83|nr:Fic family protein [Corynebacterium sp.]
MQEFHRQFVGGVMPGIAGQWRVEPVQVGSHTPPPPWNIEYMMRDAMENLAGRMEYTGDDPALQIEALAYAECAFPHVHPFKDFNGRTVRLFCWFLATRKFGLPISRTWVEAGTPAASEYINALCEFDLAKNCIPMRDFWVQNRIDPTLAH